MSGTDLRRRLLAPALVGGLVVAAVIAAVLAWRAERDEAQEANEALARQAAAAAEREVELTAASLRGGEGVLRRSGPMPERGFRRFARDVVAQTPFPALVWAPRVPARERERFERTLRRAISEPRAPTKRNPKGDLRPVAERSGAYLPIRFVHPDERGPRRLLGLDMLSEPARAAATRAARDQNEPAITPPLTLPGRDRPTVIMVDPIYAAGAAIGTPRERQLALAGIVSGSIGAESIRREIEDQIGPTDVAIKDAGTPLIAGDGNAGEGESMAVDVLGRDWDVSVEDVAHPAALPALAVGAGGLLLAALAATLFALAGRREQALSRERDLAAGEAESQRATAMALERAFLPPSLPDVPGVETAAVYAPGAEGLEVGGDFYDLFETGDRWTAMIGDVSGKGARAAALTTLVRYTARAAAGGGLTAAIREVNEAVRRQTDVGTFATACLASLRPGTDGIEIGIVVAGHPPPLVARRDGAIEPIQPTAPLIGVLEEIEVREARLRLAPGETLFLYTDGLIEARRREGGALGEERLRATVARARAGAPSEVATAALDAAAAHSPDFPQDDIAILVIRAR